MNSESLEELKQSLCELQRQVDTAGTAGNHASVDWSALKRASVRACELVEHILVLPPEGQLRAQSNRDADQIMAALREAQDESSLSFSAKEVRHLLNLWGTSRRVSDAWKSRALQTNTVVNNESTLATEGISTSDKSLIGFPVRDRSRPAQQQGYFQKFMVSRLDGSDVPGGKHHACRNFVLDLDHDPHAPAAMEAYGKSCSGSHPELSIEILAEFGHNADVPSSLVGEICVDEVHGWHMRALVPWEKIGEGTQLYACGSGGEPRSKVEPMNGASALMNSSKENENAEDLNVSGPGGQWQEIR